MKLYEIDGVVMCPAFAQDVPKDVVRFLKANNLASKEMNMSYLNGNVSFKTGEIFTK